MMGLIPGLGSAAAAFVAYGHAKQTSRTSESFGEGNIEGVIASESANDAVEGGALASTIAFGIPGSSSMAIVLAGLFVLGLRTGPDIVSSNTDLVFVMIFTVVIGNFFGTLFGMFLVNPLSRLTSLSSSLLVPVLIAVIFTGAYPVNRSMFDIGIMLSLGLVAYLMKQLKYSRSSLLVGFVLGSALEKNLFLALQIDGNYFFLQPVPLVLSLITIGFLAINILAIRRQKSRKLAGLSQGGEGKSAAGSDEQEATQTGLLELYFIGLAAVIFLAALAGSLSYESVSANIPIVILLPLLALTGVQIYRTKKESPARPTDVSMFMLPETTSDRLGKAFGFLGWTAGLLGLIVIAGHYIGIAAFIFVLLRTGAKKDLVFSLAVASSVTLSIYILFETAFEIELYRGLIFQALAGYKVF
jgi:hypothetical protein